MGSTYASKIYLSKRIWLINQRKCQKGKIYSRLRNIYLFFNPMIKKMKLYIYIYIYNEKKKRERKREREKEKKMMNCLNE